MQNQTFKLSLKPNDYPPNPPFVYADQYDVGRTFVATVYDADGTLYNFTTETVTVVGTKPSGTGFSYTATASGNTVTFETTGQMTVVAGNVTCGIIIEKDGDRIGTLHFVLHIQPAALSSDTIIDSDDFGSIITEAVEEWMDEHGIVIDDTLSVAGAAADAKKTGDEIAELKSAFDLDSLTSDVKTALMELVNHIGVWTDGNAQAYISNLYTALYVRYWQITNTLSHCTTSNAAEQVVKGNSYSATITAASGYTMTGATVSVTMGGTDVTASVYNNGVITIPSVTGALVITVSAAAKTVSSISAVFTQGANVIYNVDQLDTLKQYLVVTATYTDSTSETLSSSAYTLSGTLTAGTSTITATFGGKTDTFTVTVTDFMLNDIFTLDGEYNTRNGHDAASTKWEDLSGNENDFNLISGASAPSWGANYAGFDATNRASVNSNNLWSGKTTLTIEIVASITGAGSGTDAQAKIGMILGNIYGSGSNAFRINSYVTANGYGVASHYNGANPGYSGGFADGHPQYIAYVFTASDVKRYVNGSLQGTVSATFPPGTLPNPLYLGGWNSDYYYNGNLYRIGMSGSALSADDIASRYAFYKSRFNLPNVE